MTSAVMRSIITLSLIFIIINFTFDVESLSPSRPTYLFEDVYVEVVENERYILEEHYKLKLKVIGNYEDKAGNEHLKNGQVITDVYTIDEEALNALEKGDILKVDFYLFEGTSGNGETYISVEAVEHTDLPISLWRYHKPVYFWTMIIIATGVIAFLVIVLIRLIKKRRDLKKQRLKQESLEEEREMF